MTTAAARTIILDGMVGRKEERLVAATPKPGALVMLNSSGKWAVHGTSGGAGASALLLEDRYQGDHTTGGGVDKAYVADNPAEVEYVLPGSLRYARLKANENVALGDHLISGGDGTLIKTTGSPAKVFAVCEEASNSASEQLIKVRFI